MGKRPRLVLMDYDLSSRQVFHFLIAHDMVDMAVRVDDILDGVPSGPGLFEDPLAIGRGVDHQGFIRFLACHDVCENGKAPYFHLLYEHVSSLKAAFKFNTF